MEKLSESQNFPVKFLCMAIYISIAVFTVPFCDIIQCIFLVYNQEASGQFLTNNVQHSVRLKKTPKHDRMFGYLKPWIKRNLRSAEYSAQQCNIFRGTEGKLSCGTESVYQPQESSKAFCSIRLSLDVFIQAWQSCKRAPI